VLKKSAVILSEAKDLSRNLHPPNYPQRTYGRVSRRCMLNFPASPPRASGCAVYFGVIRLENTACCVAKLARNDGRKNLHPHSTQRNGLTNAAVNSVFSKTPFLRDRRTHSLRQLGQRGDGK
jgi:hypothetical protein